MTQIKIEGQTIVLQVKKAPILLRLIFFLLAGISLFGPLVGIAIHFATGSSFHIKNLIAVGIGGFIGIWFLRFALWNSVGSERIRFHEKTISCEANYGWFMDGRKTLNAEEAEFRIEPIGYVEDGMGILIIEDETDSVRSSVKVPLDELRALLDFLDTNEEFGNEKTQNQPLL